MPNDNSFQIEKRTFSDGQAELHIGIARVNVTTFADRLHVEYGRGNTDDVLVFSVNGHRQAVRIKLTMAIQSPTPAVSAKTSFSEQLENAPVEAEEAQRLLAIYDLFHGRTYHDSE
jgi:hypothetical protein